MKRALAFVCMFVLVGSALVASVGLALTMAPALLLLALLAGGVRPGEALIERLRGRRRSAAPRRPRAASTRRPRLALVARPAAGPVASALAMRPPPSGLAVPS
jgi:hypothetical protein